jgi:predicted LPLAT superfamily acyltransferase
MVVRPRNTLAIWHYFRRRQGYGVFKTFVHLVRNHYAFGQVVIDRFASYAGKRFDIRLDGPDIYREVESAGTGFMTISSHVGNFEMAGYALHASRRLNVLGYGGEVEAVKSGRNRLLSENNIRMVPVTDGISHIFVLREALENGETVDIHGDRLFGSTKSLVCNVLGAPAHLPQGPFALATSVDLPAMQDATAGAEAATSATATLELSQKTASQLQPLPASAPLPVIAVFCMKTGHREFTVSLRRLDAPSDDALSRKDRTQILAQRYADALSDILRRYPDQWFNFFEFWD